MLKFIGYSKELNSKTRFSYLINGFTIINVMIFFLFYVFIIKSFWLSMTTALIMLILTSAFYLRGISMKIFFAIQTAIVIVCLTLPSNDSFIYSLFSLFLFVWMGMVLLGIWKLLFYKRSLVKKIVLAKKAPTDNNLKKLGKHISNRRIKLNWLVNKDQRLVDTLVQIYKDSEHSSYIDPETRHYYEQVLIESGFEVVLNNV